MATNLKTRDLSCYHVGGREELMDGLSNGTLTASEQRTLWLLAQKFADLPNYFTPEDVSDYETEVIEDGWSYRESWHCPVCGEYHRDDIEKGDY